MAPPFHLRKFLSTDSSDEESPPSCYTCSACDPEDCFTPPPLTVSHHRIPLLLIIMLSVLAFAILLISYLALTRYRNRPTTTRRRIMQPSSTALAESEVAFREADDEEEVEPQEEDQGTPAVDHHVWYIRTVGFPQSVIDSITVFRYKSGEGLIEGTDCSVCLNEFEEDETLRLLPKCSHAFHLPCIDTWLRAHKNCPVCRAPIMVLNNVPGSSVDGNMPDFANQAENDSDTRQEIGTQESGEIRAGGPGNVPTMPIQEDAVKIRRGTNPGHGDFRVLSDLSHHRVKIDQESQPVRRSASLDLSSTSIAIKEGRLDKQGPKNSGIVKLIKSASFGRSLQKGPVSMKRSISLNGKRLLWKNNSRRQKSIYI